MSYGLFCNLKYQKAIGNYFTLGLNGRYYSDFYQPGIKFDIFSRYFPLGVFEYFYVQPKFSLGQHNIYSRYTLDGNSYLINDGVTRMYKKNIIGFGLDAGIQIPVSKNKRLFFDLTLGYNYYPFPNDIPTQIERNNINFYYTDKIKVAVPVIGGLRDKEIGKAKWYSFIYGPGTKFDFCFTLGWVF